MYIQEYEPTQDDYDEMDYWFQYEQRPFAVTCELCGKQARGSQGQLEQDGWTLERFGEFCPTCSKGI